MLTVDFFPRIHTAIAEWMACMTFILPQRKRFGDKDPRQFALYGLFLLLQLLICSWMDSVASNGQWMMLMLTAMLSMFLMILATCRMRAVEACYIWAHAFLAAEFTASMAWQMNYYLLAGNNVSALGTWLVMGAVYALDFGVIYAINRRITVFRWRQTITLKELVSVMITAIAAFALSNLSFALKDHIFTELLGTGVLYSRTLVDFGGLAMLYAHDESQAEMNLRMELKAMENLLNRQYEQYRQFEINNKAIHRVYHDLKHQIEFIRNEPNKVKRDSYLAELDRVVSVREAQVDTGNSVLDTLLTSKCMTCLEQGITLTCFADAHDLGFIDVMDICSIFGNAIDNAIECVQQIEDKSKRLIKVSVRTQNRFLLIRIENYCETPVDLRDGLPRTTKGNRSLHGYGIKSIQQTVEKYGGCFTLEQPNSWFTVTALIPVPELKVG